MATGIKRIIKRLFRAHGQHRKFGKWNPANIRTQDESAWRWGDIDKILSQIPGTFGDYD